MNVVVAMAGRGSRLAHKSTTPKPLVQVAGRPMVAWALQSLKNLTRSRVVFVILEEHDIRYGLSDLLRQSAEGPVEVIKLPGVTEGQLSSVLSAREFIDTEEDLMIASADTYVLSDIGRDIAKQHVQCRGIISVAHMAGDKWSFAKTDNSGCVVEVAEKKRISDYASTGLYYFSNGTEFVAQADETIRAKKTTNGEYYVISVYERYIKQRSRIDISLATEMWDMGTPESLAAFERNFSTR